MQSVGDGTSKLHVAIIMDGNGRWASRQGLPRPEGHRRGMEAVRRTAEAAADMGVGTLTMFAFSSANWKRPADEVANLMWLFRAYLRADLPRLVASGARLSIIGRRDRLPARLRHDIRIAERATAAGRRIHVRIAIDYSSREAIVRAAAAGWDGEGALPRELFGQPSQPSCPETDDRLADVDLMIRTGGEMRLSDFLLWECAYAELWFTDKMWPDFDQADLAAALGDFWARERTFGAVPTGLAAPEPERLAG